MIGISKPLSCCIFFWWEETGPRDMVKSNFQFFAITRNQPPHSLLISFAMSSIRNSLHRPTHKERSQLSHRAKLGFLEKHKDYVLRARDYHSKQERIRRLQQKAADRNKDEFYFGMNKQKTRVCLAVVCLISLVLGHSIFGTSRAACTYKTGGIHHCPSTS